MKSGEFYLVATPIGNLKDISQRAIETLKEVDFIACEDTRTTKILLEKYEILTPCFSYHKFNEKERCEYILRLLNEGKSIALVSDAGTPCLCDPGKIILEFLYDNSKKAISIGGISALTSFLSLVPRKNEDFFFNGFLPKEKNKRKDLFLFHKSEDFIFYDSPNRLVETLCILRDIRSDAKVAVARELSKKFEEVKIGSVGDIIEYYQNNILKGEIVAMVYHSEIEACELEVTEKINKLKAHKFSNKDISIILSSLFDLNKNEIYRKCL